MIRILTVFLLPLLFFATSCDSGGDDGSACNVNPTGTWEFTEFNLNFSDECTCSDGDCNELYGGDRLNEVSCIHPDIGGGFILWNTCECYDRGMSNCNNYDTNSNQYICEDSGVYLKDSAGAQLYDGDKWTISNGNDVATMIIEDSIEDFILGHYISGTGIQMPIWSNYSLGQSALDFGDGCTVTTTTTLMNCGASCDE